MFVRIDRVIVHGYIRFVSRHPLHPRSISNQVDHNLGELNCLVSTFPVNLYFINPPIPFPSGEEEGAGAAMAKSDEGIMPVDSL
jgi:hypothetical protein